jgi:hypothetical protein
MIETTIGCDNGFVGKGSTKISSDNCFRSVGAQIKFSGGLTDFVFGCRCKIGLMVTIER